MSTEDTLASKARRVRAGANTFFELSGGERIAVARILDRQDLLNKPTAASSRRSTGCDPNGIMKFANSTSVVLCTPQNSVRLQGNARSPERPSRALSVRRRDHG
jgi:hypothetical protein